MKKLLRVLNPIIFLLNLLQYQAHLENYRPGKNPEPYDFSKDLKYF